MIEKEITLFASNLSRCKVCEKDYKQQYYNKNKDVLTVKYKSHKDANREYYREYSRNYDKVKKRESDKKSYQKHKEKRRAEGFIYRAKSKERIAKTNRDYIANDLQARLRLGLRTRINKTLKQNSKAGSAVSDLGCSVIEFKHHLEKLFKPGMSWQNWSRTGWHIDHIIPLSKYDLTDRKQFLEACNYTNMQPLWAKENLSKHNKVSISKDKFEFDSEEENNEKI